MNIHHLNLFFSVATTGSLSATSRVLHISQSALSQEIKTFEDRLGIALFERAPRGMILTPAGDVLEKYAKQIFDIVENAKLTMQEIVNSHVGNITIGASNTIGTYILPPLIIELKNSHPEVKISLFTGNSRQVCEGVKERRFHLGLIEGPVHHFSLVAEPFSADELVPVTCAGSPLAQRNNIAPGQWEKQLLLLRERESGMRELTLEMFNQRKVRIKNMIEFNSTEAIKQALIGSHGIAWLPRDVLKTEFETGVLTSLPWLGMEIKRTFSVVRRKNAPVNAWVDHIIQSLGRH